MSSPKKTTPVEPAEPVKESGVPVAEPAVDETPAIEVPSAEEPTEKPTGEPTTKSAPESAPESAPLAEVTPMGKKYFNEIKRIIPSQQDGDPLGDLPMQSR